MRNVLRKMFPWPHEKKSISIKIQKLTEKITMLDRFFYGTYILITGLQP